jgi:DME family drug/metabolite transporter
MKNKQNLKRPLFASIIVIAYAVLKRERPNIWSLLVGALGLAPLYISYFLAVERVGAAIASVLLYTAPIWVTLASPALGEEIRKYDIFHVIVGFIGTWLVITQGTLSLKLDSLGLVFGLTSGISYATYILLARYSQLRGASVLDVGFYSIPIAAIIVLIFVHPEQSPSPLDVYFALYLAILGTAIPYILNATALRRLRAPLVSVMSLAEPLTAVSLAILILGENMSFYQALGAGLIIGSVASSALHALRE